MKFAINLSKALLVVFVAANTIGLYLLFQQVSKPKAVEPQPNSGIQVPVGQEVDLSAYATKSYVDQKIAGIPEATKTETVTVVKTPIPQKQTAIIPISGSFSTQNMDWTDVPNSDFYLDLVTDYGEAATSNWEAFIYEQHGNGKVYARLYDVTHSIGVVGSEVETNNAVSTLETSAGILGIWRGKNLYRVQIKSQKGFPVYFNSGRLKITY